MSFKISISLLSSLHVFLILPGTFCTTWGVGMRRFMALDYSHRWNQYILLCLMSKNWCFSLLLVVLIETGLTLSFRFGRGLLCPIAHNMFCGANSWIFNSRIWGIQMLTSIKNNELYIGQSSSLALTSHCLYLRFISFSSFLFGGFFLQIPTLLLLSPCPSFAIATYFSSNFSAYHHKEKILSSWDAFPYHMIHI